MATLAKTSKPSATVATVAAKPKNAPKNTPSARAKPGSARPARAETGARTAPALLPISDEHRRRYIELAAFYIAERRGFSGGNSLEDWLQAEAEIDQLLRQGKINR
ncbi:MAG: DUF2934 domain-containing protein [Betaproteobacteria bacterium]|nr:DUF2934 domain-containing protein [Betaproteobacteria bacterium]